MELKATVTGPNTVQMYRVGTEGCGLVMEASDLRKEKTGLHASLSLYRREPNGTNVFLEGTQGNIERIEVRRTVLKAAKEASGENAAKAFGPSDEENFVKRDLSLFCMKVAWDTLMQVDPATMVLGDGTIPLTFQAGPFVLKDAGAIAFGDPDSCKTWLELIRAVCIDAGLNHYWNVEQANALYINLERNNDSIARRLGWVNLALGLPENRPLAVLNARGRGLLAIRPHIEAIVKERNIGYAALDSISRADTGDANQAEPVNAIMNLLTALVPTWVAIGHSGHSDKNRIMGNTAFLAAADVHMKVSSERQNVPTGGTEVGVKINHTKANDIEFAQPQFLTLGFRTNNAGLKSIEVSRAEDWPKLSADTGDQGKGKFGGPTNTEVIMEFLKNGAAQIDEIEAATGIDPSIIRARLSDGQWSKFMVLNPKEKVHLWGLKQK